MSGGKVSFLVAGVQKGGTTALFDYLAELPGVQLPPVKEAHFFDDEERVDWTAPDYAPYHALFRDDGRLWGEATPIYLYWPNAVERIARYNPAMKLICIFRDPVERAWSHWKMEYAKRKETEPFGWCIREGRARMAAGAPYPGFHRVYSYVERGYYGRQLARLLRAFPRDQLLLLGSEQLRRDPAKVIARISAFLGIPAPIVPAAPQISHPAADITYPSTLTASDVSFLQRHYVEEMARFHALAGQPHLLD
ncbi:sulfotransferase domain-containing protein [uncultured Sphingomonas sp.]|uniref:sulfotransferase domain-containing protein n=1 Tax=uncultured Sphingomonas sp. TaxID=158754 RepID=UPI0025E31352|nr:sulfotransferase domain-containing protein [uncultured Sphingomonas sp.]